ncbi:MULTISPECIES: XRE family transcriptional regulator [Microbacterium]|uniref:Cupin domain-containing protein n=1 Tax=Microbacterium saccharophilum TaxID=1213358 RepID=A0A7Z7D1U9_9MICO|nr:MULTISPECIES: XRE family transcriptional regulator [Microbacterium]SFI78349.1 Cupin domain-containing protein [Microbacterium saccharophilum]
MTGTAHVVGRNIKRARQESGWSLGRLARESGLSKQTIAVLERGLGNPTVETIDALAAALKVSARALVSEIGSEVLLLRGDDVTWQDHQGFQLRNLDAAFGSGYVHNVILRLHADHGAARRLPASRGSLRHCYVVSGRARLGPETGPVIVGEGDFIRFPADTAHVFQSITPASVVFVCTTAPQLTAGESERF